MTGSNDNDESSSSSTSGCPVVAKDASVESSSTNSWSAWLGFGGIKGSSNASDTTSSSSSSSTSACPVQQQQQQTPASLEEAAAYSQDPHPDQQGVALSTRRMISSIPRGKTEEQGPHHQPSGHSMENGSTTTSEQPSHWIYPSEQQFFHALRKKGWNHVGASSIPSVLEIHNTINERTWKQVQEWEQGMDLPTTSATEPPIFVETNLKLVRFLGRPNDLSPLAFWNTKINSPLQLWNGELFDRHDWYVQKQQQSTNTTNTTVQHDFPIQRYVIDYYMLPPPDPDMPPTPYVDVRPALDSPRAVLLRATRFFKEELPALHAAYVDYKSRQPRYYDGHGPYTKATEQPKK